MLLHPTLGGPVANTLLTLFNAPQARAHYAAGYWRDETIYGLVSGHAQRTPDKVAVREGFRRITYRELVDAADALAASLHAAGVQTGMRVAVWLPSRAETAVAVLACSRNGYVCCPSLHRDHTVDEVVGLVERMRASAVVAERGYGADARSRDLFELLSHVDTLRLVVPLEPRSDAHVEGAVLAGLGQAVTAPQPVHTDPDSVVYLAFTSGTTGQPKGVMHSDNTLLAPVRALASDWALHEDMVVYSISPLSHNLGFGAMVLALTGGGELVVHDLPKGASLTDRLTQTGTTFVFGVPTHAIDLLSELKARGAGSLGRVKGFRISGAPVPPAVAQSLLEHGVVPQSGYGMTEAGSHHYTRPDDDPAVIVETSGRPCAGYDVRVFSREDPTTELPPGEIGQIGGRGASLMLGYFDDQMVTEDSFNSDGWFLTGDLGVVDEAGYLRVTGRKKDLIIRGGHNIYPAKIEHLALGFDVVQRAAVIPVPDERLGEKVCLVVTSPAARVDPDQMLDHLDAAGLSRYDMPEYFLQLDDMPLMPSGKVLKRILVEWVEQGRVQPTPVRFSSRT
jgi:acyl-CoA synthetase (AMP-forming)/AMP-acid ligase II